MSHELARIAPADSPPDDTALRTRKQSRSLGTESPNRVCLVQLDAHSSNQSQTLSLALGLRSDGWDAHIACRSGSDLAVKAADNGVPVQSMPTEGGRPLLMAWKLVRALKAGHSGKILLHACDPQASRLASLAWKINKKLRVVHTRRVPVIEQNHKALRCYQVPPAKVIADSLAGKIALRLTGLESHNLHTIPCGVDPLAVPGRVARNDGRFIYAFVGELMPLRGHAELFDAIPLLKDNPSPSPWEIRILGNGPHFATILAEAEHRKVTSHLAFLSGLDPLAEIGNCDALVLPASEGESYLPRILEGWAASIPVVTVNRLDHAEILQDGGNCLLVQPGDARSLADQMARIASDDLLRGRLVKGGRESLEKFSRRQMIAEHRKIYREILA